MPLNKNLLPCIFNVIIITVNRAWWCTEVDSDGELQSSTWFHISFNSVHFILFNSFYILSGWNYFAWILNSLWSWQVDHQRYLAKQGMVVEQVKNMRKLRHIFLFNDVLVCARQKISSSRFWGVQWLYWFNRVLIVYHFKLQKHHFYLLPSSTFYNRISLKKVIFTRIHFRQKINFEPKWHISLLELSLDDIVCLEGEALALCWFL